MVTALILLAMLQAAAAPLDQAVKDAIQAEIEFGLEATVAKDIDRYMETVPADYRIVEDDGSVTDREALKAKQLQAWAIIPRTNALTVEIDGLTVGCEGACATVQTRQRWDRQMLGKDAATEFNVVTTQRHTERWEIREGRWLQVSVEELGGTTVVDGKPY